MDPIEIPLQLWGCRVVPIKKGLKRPCIPDWPNIQTRGCDIGDTLVDPYDKYGVVLDPSWVVFDIDVHDGQADGYESLSRFKEDTGVDLLGECCFHVVSPSGGRHMYFRKNEGQVLPGKLEGYPAIDVLSKGKQVIGPNSHHADLPGIYEIEYERGDAPCYLEPHVIEAVLGLAKAEPDRPVLPAEPLDAGESPVDAFNIGHKGVDVVRQGLEDRKYTVTWRGDGTYEFIRPGKRESGNKISGTLGRTSSSGRKILKNFSSSDDTFPTDESLTVAEAYRRLEGLTHQELPLKLRELGFGSSLEPTVDVSGIQESLRLAREHAVEEGDILERDHPTLSLDQLIEAHPTRKPYVIEGLLRRDEVMNLIAAPKTGKSWFVYNMAVTLATGGEFLGWRSPKNLRALIIDNELDGSELAWRVRQVRDALSADFGDSLQFNCLRGCRVTIDTLYGKLAAAKAGQFDVIFLDALYRFLPDGTSENDNAQMTSLYNQLDRFARDFGVAVVCVHHTSKGDQSGKDVTDVGAGAGAISRAADSQIVLLPHESEGKVVVDAVARSSAKPEARTAYLEGARWILDKDTSPERRAPPGMPAKKKGLNKNQIKSIQYGLDRVRKARLMEGLLREHSILDKEMAGELNLSQAVFAKFLTDWLVGAGVVIQSGSKWRRQKGWEESLQDFLENPFRDTEDLEVVAGFNKESG